MKHTDMQVEAEAPDGELYHGMVLQKGKQRRIGVLFYGEPALCATESKAERPPEHGAEKGAGRMPRRRGGIFGERANLGPAFRGRIGGIAMIANFRRNGRAISIDIAAFEGPRGVLRETVSLPDGLPGQFVEQDMLMVLPALLHGGCSAARRLVDGGTLTSYTCRHLDKECPVGSLGASSLVFDISHVSQGLIIKPVEKDAIIKVQKGEWAMRDGKRVCGQDEANQGLQDIAGTSAPGSADGASQMGGSDVEEALKQSINTDNNVLNGNIVDYVVENKASNYPEAGIEDMEPVQPPLQDNSDFDLQGAYLGDMAVEPVQGLGPSRPITPTGLENCELSADHWINSERSEPGLFEDEASTGHMGTAYNEDPILEDSAPFGIQVACGACGAENYIRPPDINDIANDILGTDIVPCGAQDDREQAAAVERPGSSDGMPGMGFSNAATLGDSRYATPSGSDDSSVRDATEPLFVINLDRPGVQATGNKADYVLSEDSSASLHDAATGSAASILNRLQSDLMATEEDYGEEETSDSSAMGDALRRHKLGPIVLDVGKTAGRCNVCEIKILVKADVKPGRDEKCRMRERPLSRGRLGRTGDSEASSGSCAIRAQAPESNASGAGGDNQADPSAGTASVRPPRVFGPSTDTSCPEKDHLRPRATTITFVEDGERRCGAACPDNNSDGEQIEYPEFPSVEETIRKFEGAFEGENAE